jgi:hypothetical protein
MARNLHYTEDGIIMLRVAKRTKLSTAMRDTLSNEMSPFTEFNL